MELKGSRNGIEGPTAYGHRGVCNSHPIRLIFSGESIYHAHLCYQFEQETLNGCLFIYLDHCFYITSSFWCDIWGCFSKVVSSFLGSFSRVVSSFWGGFSKQLVRFV